MKLLCKHIYLLIIILLACNVQAQKFELLPYGNMNSWMVREIKESYVIGGKKQYLYEITPQKDTLKNNVPYKKGKSPWATSSVLATVSGVTKGSVTVFPEKRDNGYAARLETRVERVKVLGLININVLASGTIFLGEMQEPITDTKNPRAKLDTGITFTKKPQALQFDYKIVTGGASTKINGMSSKGTAVNEKDNGEVQIILQKRWEDPNGNIYAKRIATGWQRFNKTVTTWQNKYQVKINYGDISKQSYFQPYMGLKKGDQTYYAKNSKGKIVPINEQDWGTEADGVTHLILQFSSSNGAAYTGNTNSKFWIDNVGFVYKN